MPKLGNSILYNYQYDQLNRLIGMDAWKGTNNTWGGLSATNDYKERFTYNPDGGITSLLRHGAGRTIDSAAWNYNTGKHQLNNINDPAGRFGFDAGVQSNNNYTYSPIGEMTRDAERGMTNIDWTVYGKVKSQTINGTTITYTYDASGNRLTKKVADTTEVYVRDASGNVMGIYKQKGSTAALVKTETDIYGSSRIGSVSTQTTIPDTITLACGYGKVIVNTLTREETNYQVTDHRGNVMLTLADRKLQVTANNSTVAYYTADVATAQDYSSFGSLLEGRQYGNTIRRTYNDKELDKETGWQDYGMRPYLVDVPIFARVDPLTNNFAFYSPYHYAGNNPIRNTDLDGGEPKDYTYNWKYQSMFDMGTNKKVSDITGSLTVYDAKLGPVDAYMVYDKWTQTSWIVANVGTDHYYLKNNNNGNPSEMTITPNKNTGIPDVKDAHFEKFDTQNRLQARYGAQSADMLGKATFGIFAVGAAVPAMAAIGGESLIATNKIASSKFIIGAGTILILQIARGEKINVFSAAASGYFGNPFTASFAGSLINTDNGVPEINSLNKILLNTAVGGLLGSATERLSGNINLSEYTPSSSKIVKELAKFWLNMGAGEGTSKANNLLETQTELKKDENK